MTTAQFSLVQDWGTGFEGNITLVNDGSLVFKNWELEFTADFEITSLWNAEIVSHEGNRYVIRFVSWNPDLDIGETINIGFNGRSSNDNIIEPYDYFLNGQALGNSNSLPSVSVSDVTVTEGDNGISYANYTVNLSAASDEVISVDYATNDGTAVAQEDYNPLSALPFVGYEVICSKP